MKKLILTIFVLFVFGALPAQDIHFSQINETPLLLNPASAGTTGGFRGIMNYRDQWKSITVPYRTFDLSVDWVMKGKDWKKGALGGGLLMFHDIAGTSKMGTISAILNLSGIVHLDAKNILSAGLAGGFAQKSYQGSTLKWDNQYNGQSYDPALSSNEPFVSDKFSYGDFSAGVQWMFGEGERYITANDEVKANFGISMFHFNQPVQVFSAVKDRMYSKYLLNGGMAFGIKNTPFCIAPSFMYAMQGPGQEFTFGTMLKYKIKEDSRYTGFKKGASVSLGGYYRNHDAFVGVFQLEIAQYSLGFSYDFNTSDLRSVSGGKGGFEISLRFLSSNPYIFKSSSSF